MPPPSTPPPIPPIASASTSASASTRSSPKTLGGVGWGRELDALGDVDVAALRLPSPLLDLEVERRRSSRIRAKEGAGDEEGDSGWDCHICFEPASHPVTTDCGHLFCWPCLYTWLNRPPPSPAYPGLTIKAPPDTNVCPICKHRAPGVIPLYARGRMGALPKDVPERPKAVATAARKGMAGSNLYEAGLGASLRSENAVPEEFSIVPRLLSVLALAVILTLLCS